MPPRLLVGNKMSITCLWSFLSCNMLAVFLRKGKSRRCFANDSIDYLRYCWVFIKMYINYTSSSGVKKVFDPYNIDFSFYVVDTVYTTRQWFSLQMPLIVAIFHKKCAIFFTIIYIFYRRLRNFFYSINKLIMNVEKCDFN